MVRVGDKFTCDKVSLKGAPDDFLDHYDKKAFSKGVFTLLDLGPPPWIDRFSWSSSEVKVKDWVGLEGWICIKDFDSYRRGQKYRPDGLIKRWISHDQLKKGRSERDETQRKEAEGVEQEKRKQKEKENQKEALTSTQRSLLAHLKPKDRTASGGSTSRDSGIGSSSSSKLSERHYRLISDLALNPNPRPRTSSSSTNAASSSTSTPQSTKRKAEEIEQKHLKEVQRIRDEHEKERKKIRREQEREVKHLKLKHNVKIQEANLEEAKKELEEFEAESD